MALSLFLYVLLQEKSAKKSVDPCVRLYIYIYIYVKESDFRTRTSSYRTKQRGRRKKRSRKARPADIKAIFLNVAGAAKMKAEDWGYVKKFDIIGLVETWEEKDKGRRAEAYIKEYEVR